jgi:hypothetical protein
VLMGITAGITAAGGQDDHRSICSGALRS